MMVTRLPIVMLDLSETDEYDFMLRTLPHGASELADYFNYGSALNEREMLGAVVAELLIKGEQVNHHTLIARLSQLLADETDAVKVDVCRCVLERVIQKTPGES
ncbi:biofilm development regulator YmgB/AriR family protein [Duffyella gerundensis]|uniref:biofilm development regulator YmgB/AriR family protein n=1 Tax=Duffyella gerundensis TaxID=1619313 RepID=UPI0016541C21|nr:biofilm development regulator YmgB/AriR family protein [Duffyella gerundensis]